MFSVLGRCFIIFLKCFKDRALQFFVKYELNGCYHPVHIINFRSKEQTNQSESDFIISFFTRYPFSIKLVNSVISILLVGNAIFKKILSSFDDKKNIPSISRLLFIFNILLI